MKNFLSPVKNAVITAACILVLASCKEDKLRNSADITAFTVDGVAWTISGTDITYAYPTETQEGLLTPVIALSPGATVSPASGTAQNFFTPQGVAYTVTAEDGVTTKTYTAKAIIVVASGATGDCIWTITGVAPNYTLAISGNGAIGDYYWENPCPWEGYRTEIGTLIIHEGVTNIGNSTFFNYIGLTGINVDASNAAYSSVDGVLFNKEQTTLIIYPTGRAGSYVIPNSVTTIGEDAFAYCSGLTSVTIGNSVTTIGNSAFAYCSGLTSVTIGNSVTAIGENAFGDCSELESVIIPNSVITVSTWAFSNCSGLTSVTIGNSVTTVGEYAFSGCLNLTSITIPNSVSTINNFAFFLCSSLTEINVDDTNAAYSSVDGVLFNKGRTTLIIYPGGKAGSYDIPNSVTTVGYSAFYDCNSLTSVTIPNSVTTVDNYAFDGCNGLNSVTNLSATPQNISSSVFWNVTLIGVTLKVPA
ncbi:MAG: leucine-rich repeat protein, partial [Bacteroidales bacterium]|nr:leucine-rich repeat protein [Bacteroidales bacterium]